MHEPNTNAQEYQYSDEPSANDRNLFGSTSLIVFHLFDLLCQIRENAIALIADIAETFVIRGYRFRDIGFCEFQHAVVKRIELFEREIVQVVGGNGQFG